jgi:hypothetical protein
LERRAFDDAAAASDFFAFFFHRTAFSSARSSLALSLLTVALSFFSEEELAFFAVMAYLP